MCDLILVLFEFVLRWGFGYCLCVGYMIGLGREIIFSCEVVGVGCVGSLVGVFVEVLLV